MTYDLKPGSTTIGVIGAAIEIIPVDLKDMKVKSDNTIIGILANAIEIVSID